MDKEQFYVALREYGVQLSMHDAQTLLEYLDTAENGNVNLDYFLQQLRGTPNATRQAYIDKVFQKFDPDGSGFVNAYDLRMVYDCSQHPKVISGERCFDEVFVEFLACFGDPRRDGSISRAEWNDYYAAVSAQIENDDHFIELLK